MSAESPDRDSVTNLFERFWERAPEEARALARSAGESATEAWQQYWKPWEGLGAPAGRLLVVGGAGLFLAGWLVGRHVRVSPGAAVAVAAAVAGGVAAGMVIGAHSCGVSPVTDPADA
jgi:hypothetical protein